MSRMSFGFLLLALTSLPVCAEEFNKTYNVNGAPVLHLETDDASVRLRSCDCKQVEAHVYIQGYKPDQVRMTENQSGDQINFAVRTRDRHVNINLGTSHRSIRIEVTVPQQSNLDVHTSDGRIDAENIQGDIRLNTSDGRIQAAHLKGKLELHTSDGHIELSDADGQLDARTSDGHIRALGRFDDLNLETSDGEIFAEVRAGSKMSSSWNVRSQDGRVTLRLPQEFSAELYARSGDGTIHSDLPITMEAYSNRHEVRGRLNGGGSTLTVRTNDGSIYLERL
jgi:DUF4097 and DUF4098 domain-containing protein YvlB